MHIGEFLVIVHVVWFCGRGRWQAEVCNTPGAMERSPGGGNMIRSVVYVFTPLVIVALFLITTMSRRVGHEVRRPLTEKCKVSRTLNLISLGRPIGLGGLWAYTHVLTIMLFHAWRYLSLNLIIISQVK